MTRAPWAVAGAAIALLVVPLGVQTWRLETARRALTAARLAPQQRAVEAAQARVETVTVKLAAAERVVTRTIQAVRIDTLMVAPETAADTARAVAQLPALAIAHDSLQRACSAFVLTCTEFRAATAAKDSATSARISGLEAALAHEQPSRIKAVWEKVDGPLLFVAGVVAGSRIR